MLSKLSLTLAIVCVLASSACNRDDAAETFAEGVVVQLSDDGTLRFWETKPPTGGRSSTLYCNILYAGVKTYNLSQSDSQYEFLLGGDVSVASYKLDETKSSTFEVLYYHEASRVLVYRYDVHVTLGYSYSGQDPTAYHLEGTGRAKVEKAP